MNIQTLKSQRATMQKSVNSPNLSDERKQQLRQAIANIDSQLVDSPKPKAKAKTAKAKAPVAKKKTVAKAKTAKKKTAKAKAPAAKKPATTNNELIENKALFDFYGMVGQKITFDRLSGYVNTFFANIKANKIRKDSANYTLLSKAFNISKNAYNAAVRNKNNTLTLKAGADVTSKIEKMIVNAIQNDLKGLRGDDEDEDEDLDGLGCACTPNSSLQGKSSGKKKSLGVIPASDLNLDSIGDKLPLKSDWLPIFGKPTRGFKTLIFGKAGSGKTTMLLDFAKDFSKIGKICYVTGEQAKERDGKIEVADTFIERAVARGANIKNIDVVAKFPDLEVYDLSMYELIILDSVQALNMQPEDLAAIAEKYPDLSIIFVNQITKDNKYKGSTEWAHDTDIIIELESYGNAEATKNRFGSLGSINFE